MSNLIVHSNKCVDIPDIPCLCFFQNLCHQSLSDPLPLCKLSQNLSHTDPFHSPPVSAERSDELDEEAVVFHELATHSSCLKTCNRCSFIFITLVSQCSRQPLPFRMHQITHCFSRSPTWQALRRRNQSEGAWAADRAQSSVSSRSEIVIRWLVSK